MKKLKINYAIMLLLMIIAVNVGCDSNESNYLPENDNKILDLRNKVLDIKIVEDISRKITEKVNKDNSLQRTINFDSLDVEMRVILEPLIVNGEEIHNIMINHLEETAEYNNLSIAEKENISNFDEAQLAQLSFIMSTQVNYGESIDWSRVRSCASMALGIYGLQGLWNNTIALGTAQTTIQALKLIGRRYLGWFGVGLILADYYDCIIK